MEKYKLNIIDLTNIPIHRHNKELLFLYVLQGSLEFNVSFEKHIMKKDDFTLINTTEFHSLQKISQESCIVAMLHIDLEWVREFYPYTGYILLICDYFSSEKALSTNIEYIEKIRKMLVKIINRFAMGKEIQENKLLQILEYLYTHFTLADYLLFDDTNPLRQTKEEVYSQIYKLMRENYKRKDCVQLITKNMYYSPEYLNRIFRAFTSSSIQEGVNNIRCWESEYDLIMTDENIIDIAEKCGFSDSKYYYKYFKKWYGLTPKEYRKKWKDNRKTTKEFKILEIEEIQKILGMEAIDNDNLGSTILVQAKDVKDTVARVNYYKECGYSTSIALVLDQKSKKEWIQWFEQLHKTTNAIDFSFTAFVKPEEEDVEWLYEFINASIQYYV